MDKLEKFITENAERINDREPGQGHFDRFTDRLDREFGKPRITLFHPQMLSVAAVILLLFTAGIVLLRYTVKPGSEKLFGQQNKELPAEIRDALKYYDQQAESKMIMFNGLACCGKNKDELHATVNSQMEAINANSTELKEALLRNPDDERLQDALIRNQQMKEQMLDNVIAQLGKSKKNN